ncbi:MAG: hypothetical protein HC849_21900 [Oscillatoriales cyanobacterium RU_3_3]|nr:hypothetical protein [Oscillatoriales cyanobacterium RU_3_3]
MKVTVRDNKILKTVDPKVLGEYLQTNGWHNEGLFYGRAWIWHKHSDCGELCEIKQPVSQNFDDYSTVIGDIIKKLELTENRSQLEILSDLITCLDDTEIQGFIVKIDRPEAEHIAKVAMMGFVVGKLRKIALELTENNLNLALQAYQERIPVTCRGDFVKEGEYFVVKNLREFGLMVEAEEKRDESAIDLSENCV